VLGLDLRLGAQPPPVLDHADRSGVERPASNPVVVTFSEPISPASITPSSVVVAGPAGAPIAGTLTLSNQNAVVTFRPSAALPAETAFTVTVAGTVADLSGYTLGQAVASRFTSLDVTAPPPPAAGTLAACPTLRQLDDRGTQGTANQHDTVSISAVRAARCHRSVERTADQHDRGRAPLTDQLKLQIVDAAGNTTTGAAAFSRTNADGSVSVAIPADGGTVPAGRRGGDGQTGHVPRRRSSRSAVPEAQFPSADGGEAGLATRAACA
jgi:hypothetical protein